MEARQAVLAGLVTVGGRAGAKPSTLVSADEPVGLVAPARRFVSRGGEKLSVALRRFGVDPSGRDCLDAGASTGGFTDCLLQEGAARVVSVDVGYGQLAWSLRTDPRVTLLERTNVRDLDPSDLPFAPSLVVADLSFISLRLVVAALSNVAAPGADHVLLVKPQFEAGRRDVGSGGVVRDPEIWRRAIDDVAGACRRNGLAPRALMASPVVGPAGNVEFPLHLVRGGEEAQLAIEDAIEEGRALGGTW